MNLSRLRPRRGTSRLVIVRDDVEFARRELDIDELVVAYKRLQAAHPTNSGARDSSVLGHHHGGIALGVEMLGVENLGQGNDTADAEFAVLRSSRSATWGRRTNVQGVTFEIIAECVLPDPKDSPVQGVPVGPVGGDADRVDK